MMITARRSLLALVLLVGACFDDVVFVDGVGEPCQPNFDSFKFDEGHLPIGCDSFGCCATPIEPEEEQPEEDGGPGEPEDDGGPIEPEQDAGPEEPEVPLCEVACDSDGLCAEGAFCNQVGCCEVFEIEVPR
jgi:hypothetical protein